MSKGSDRISVRMGRSFRQAVEDYCLERATRPGSIEQWGFTDFVINAIVDKLNHIERSRKSGVKWKATGGMDGEVRRLVKWYKGRIVCQQAATAEQEVTDNPPEKFLGELTHEEQKMVLDKWLK